MEQNPITIQITQKQIEDGITNAITKAMASSYDSPIQKCIDAALKENEGAIKLVVNEIIVAAISDKEFKARVADVVIAQMVTNAIKNNR